MKVAALAVLSVLIAFPAEAGQRHRQNKVSPSCDNDGRCTTLNVTAPVSSKTPSLRGGHIRTSERNPHHSVDANGNSMMVTVQTAYGFKITVHPAYASKFLKFYALLKEHGHKVDPRINKCFSRGGHVPGSNHYIGAACDNQTGWNKAPAYMYHVGDLIRQAGLYDGCRFGDCGHVEAVRGTHNSPPNLYAAIEKFKSEQSTANYQP
jgi:hypothetical protein